MIHLTESEKKMFRHISEYLREHDKFPQDKAMAAKMRCHNSYAQRLKQQLIAKGAIKVKYELADIS